MRTREIQEILRATHGRHYTVPRCRRTGDAGAPLYILQQLHNEFRIVVQRLLVDVLENIVPLREERRFRTVHAGEVHSLEALLDCNRSRTVLPHDRRGAN